MITQLWHARNNEPNSDHISMSQTEKQVTMVFQTMNRRPDVVHIADIILPNVSYPPQTNNEKYYEQANGAKLINKEVKKSTQCIEKIRIK